MFHIKYLKKHYFFIILFLIHNMFESFININEILIYFYLIINDKKIKCKKIASKKVINNKRD